MYVHIPTYMGINKSKTGSYILICLVCLSAKNIIS